MAVAWMFGPDQSGQCFCTRHSLTAASFVKASSQLQLTAAGLHEPRLELEFQPGGAVCRASRCLWFGGVHPSVPESELHGECMHFGDILDITFPPCPMRDEAQVTFSNIQ